MSKEVLLLGEFSSGKSAFINMLLGVQLLPERMASTNLPVIKIHAGDPSGIFMRMAGRKDPTPLQQWTDIIPDWNGVEYAEVGIPGHPLLDRGLVLWDTPGINTTLPGHRDHLDKFLTMHPGGYRSTLYFVPSNLTATSLEFLRKWTSLWPSLTIVVNIKEARSSEECRQLELEVKKTVRRELSSLPVELLYLGAVCESFNQISASFHPKSKDSERVRNWSSMRVDLAELLQRHSDTIIGDYVLDSIGDIADADDLPVSVESISDPEELKRLAQDGNIDAQVRIGDWLFDQGDYAAGKHWFALAAAAGNAEAEFSLGFDAFYGLTEAASDSTALAWWRKAAAKEHPGAMNMIGSCYAAGRGVARSAENAVKWYRKAAEMRLAAALRNLAACY
jgi:hypothetical protein